MSNEYSTTLNVMSADTRFIDACAKLVFFLLF